MGERSLIGACSHVKLQVSNLFEKVQPISKVDTDVNFRGTFERFTNALV